MGRHPIQAVAIFNKMGRKNRNQVIRILGGVGILLFSLSPARAEFYLHHWEDHHEAANTLSLLPSLAYYTTKNNFDATGRYLYPAGLQKLTRLESDLELRYGWNNKLSFFGRLVWGHIQLEHDTRPGDAFGLMDQSLGGSFKIWESLTGSRVTLQLQTDFSLYNNNTSLQQGTPFLGDGSTDFTAGAFIVHPFKKTPMTHWEFKGGVGYTYRTSSFSSAIPWSASMGYFPHAESLFYKVAVLGFQSLRTDPHASSVTGTTSSLGTGGSFLSNAINPSLITLRGEVGYQLTSELGMSLAVSQSAWGQAAPNGLNIVLGLQAQWQRESTGEHKEPLSPASPDYQGSNKGFVNYTGLEAHISRVSDRLNTVKIDKGSQDGVELGQLFDIFSIRQDGTIDEPVARSKVTSLQPTEASLTVTEYFKEVWIEEGFIVKHPIQ